MEKRFFCPRCDTPLNDQYTCPGCRHEFKDEIEANVSRETLTDGQMEALDFVDNAVGDLIRQYAPDFEHDAEQVGIIRDALIDVLCRFHNIPEYDVFPWLLTPEKPSANPGAKRQQMLGRAYRNKTTLTQRRNNGSNIV